MTMDTCGVDEHLTQSLPVEWVCDEVQRALNFGKRVGWLARAQAIQRLRDHGVEIDDEIFPWPDRKFQAQPVQPQSAYM